MWDIDSNDFGFILESNSDDFGLISESVLAHLCQLVSDTCFLKTVLPCRRELNFEGPEPCVWMPICICFVSLVLGSYWGFGASYGGARTWVGVRGDNRGSNYPSRTLPQGLRLECNFEGKVFEEDFTG